MKALDICITVIQKQQGHGWPGRVQGLAKPCLQQGPFELLSAGVSPAAGCPPTPPHASYLPRAHNTPWGIRHDRENNSDHSIITNNIIYNQAFLPEKAEHLSANTSSCWRTIPLYPATMEGLFQIMQNYSSIQLLPLPFLLQKLGNHLCSRTSVLQDADRLNLPTISPQQYSKIWLKVSSVRLVTTKTALEGKNNS